MVAPGIGSQSPAFQSRTRPCGLAISSGVSCASGTATTSVHTPRCRAAKVLKARPIVAKASKAVRVGHGGAIAGLNELTKGCMSVVFRSCFSYHVAAGSTTSEKSVVLPAATWYEKHDLNTTDMHPFVNSFNPAIAPPWQTRTDFDAFATIGRAFSTLAARPIVAKASKSVRVCHG